jgi:hypothetical protein
MMRSKKKAPMIALVKADPDLCPHTHQIRAHLVPLPVVKIEALAH